MLCIECNKEVFLYRCINGASQVRFSKIKNITAIAFTSIAYIENLRGILLVLCEFQSPDVNPFSNQLATSPQATIQTINWTSLLYHGVNQRVVSFIIRDE